MQKRSGKEIYAASLLLLIGTIYLAAQADAFFSIGSVYVEGDVVKISKNEFLSHLRTVITVIMCFSGGILLLKVAKAGWIISQALLMLLFAIGSGILISNFTGLHISILVLICGILLLLLAIVFLFLEQIRKKFLITSKDVLFALVLFAALIAFYFFLQ
jgi:hypothetical protein